MLISNCFAHDRSLTLKGPTQAVGHRNVKTVSQAVSILCRILLLACYAGKAHSTPTRGLRTSATVSHAMKASTIQLLAKSLAKAVLPDGSTLIEEAPLCLLASIVLLAISAQRSKQHTLLHVLLVRSVWPDQFFLPFAHPAVIPQRPTPLLPPLASHAVSVRSTHCKDKLCARTARRARQTLEPGQFSASTARFACCCCRCFC